MAKLLDSHARDESSRTSCVPDPKERRSEKSGGIKRGGRWLDPPDPLEREAQRARAHLAGPTRSAIWLFPNALSLLLRKMWGLLCGKTVGNGWKKIQKHV